MSVCLVICRLPNESSRPPLASRLKRAGGEGPAKLAWTLVPQECERTFALCVRMSPCRRSRPHVADDLPGARGLEIHARAEDRQPQHRRGRGGRAPEALAGRRPARVLVFARARAPQTEAAAVRWAARYVAEVRPAPEAREAHLVLSAACALAGACPAAGRDALHALATRRRLNDLCRALDDWEPPEL